MGPSGASSYKMRALGKLHQSKINLVFHSIGWKVCKELFADVSLNDVEPAHEVVFRKLFLKLTTHYLVVLQKALH